MIKLLKINEVCELTRLSKSTIYRLAKDSQFPARKMIAANSAVWVRQEVEEWLNQRLGINQ